MKRKSRMLGIFAACFCVLCAGCSDRQQDAGGQEDTGTAQDTQSEQPESGNGTQAQIEQYGLDILPVVQVEAGVASLEPEQFFAQYDGQELSIGKQLTAEELACCGAIYQIPVKYQGYDLEIEVEIVDTTAPVISMVSGILVKVGDTVAYKKAVEYSDNSSNALTLSIDNSAVDLQTPGEYSVSYTVTDAGGNTATIEVPLTVVEATSHTEEDVRDLALAVVEEVVDENVSKYDNAKELFRWVHSNIRYQHAAGDRSSVWAGAYEGLHDGAGDCYAFYATYSVLLTYAGIDNLCVARVSDSSHHWWNLVNTGEGWYHCDASPRRNGDRYFCFMQTDAQVEAYTRAYPEKPDYYTFDASLLPERATEIIVGYDPDTIYEMYNTEAVERYLESLRKEEEAEDDAIEDEIDPDADFEIEEKKNADTEEEAGEADKEDTKNEAGAGNETDTEHESEAEDSEDEKSDTEKKSDKKKSDKKKKSDTSEVNGDSSTEKETETGETENGEKAKTSKKNKKKTSKKAESTQEDTEAADSETEAASEETE